MAQHCLSKPIVDILFGICKGSTQFTKLKGRLANRDGNTQFTKLKGRLVNRDGTDTGEHGTGESMPRQALVKPGLVNPQHTVGGLGMGSLTAAHRASSTSHQCHQALAMGMGGSAGDVPLLAVTRDTYAGHANAGMSGYADLY